MRTQTAVNDCYSAPEHSASETIPQDLTGQRLDVWLFRTRLLKTRSLATKMIKGKKIRLTRHGHTIRAQKPHYCLRPGDCVSFMRGTALIQVEMVQSAARRGPASEAQTLYKVILPEPLTEL